MNRNENKVLIDALKFRYKLGRWKHADGRWYLIREIKVEHGDSKCYSVVQHRASFVPIRRYRITEKETRELFRTLNISGYRQIEMQFEELQSMFNSRGEFITPATEFRDAFEVKEHETVRVLSGFEALAEMD